MKFKNFEFENCSTGINNTGYWHVDLPFDMGIDIYKVGDKYMWKFGSAYNHYKTGYAKLLENAKKNSIKAFVKYVEENLNEALEGERND